jgi:hypothetical protein
MQFSGGSYQRDQGLNRRPPISRLQRTSALTPGEGERTSTSGANFDTAVVEAAETLILAGA